MAGANDNTLQESQGVAPSLNTNKANVIVAFSVGRWIAERFHSASCGTIAQCFAHPNNCTPGTQNLFGCDIHGTMVLDSINGTAPTVGSGQNTTINPAFAPAFTRLLYEVVNQNASGGVPAYLQSYFGPTGFTCTSAVAKTDLKNYGFLVLPAGTTAGHCGA